jgi:hypothetical protein
MSRCTLFLLLLVVSLAGQNSLFATLIASGECWYTTFDEKGTGERRATRAFTATFDGCRWRIRTSQSGANTSGWGSSPYVYTEEANGADSLFVTRVFKTPDEPTESPFLATSITVAWGTTPCVDPERFTAAIWFPYASDCELGMITNGRIKHLFSMTDSYVRDDLTFPFTARFLSNSVLQELVVRNEAFQPIVKADGTIEKRRSRPPFSEGYVAFAFNVLEFTNVAKLIVPRHSQIQYFLPVPGTANTRKRAQVDVVAHSISLTNVFLPPPEIVPKPAMIYDKRLPKMGEEDFNYFNKGLVYETNSPEARRIYQKFEEHQDMIRRNAESQR